MADHVLSILPSKLCATTALCSKLILRFYNNGEHKNYLLNINNFKYLVSWRSSTRTLVEQREG